MQVDVLINNGLVVDGSGAKAKVQPVAIKDNKIVLPTEQEVEAKEVIDAKGLVVSPGFIDIHTHTDLTLLIDSRGAGKLSQGVTTDIAGNCGFSAAPCPPSRKKLMMETGSLLEGAGLDWDWEDYVDYAKLFDDKISINLGYFMGHGSIRAAVMGYDDRPPTAQELQQMKDYVAQGMENGAVGISSGLGYAPGMFSDTDEMVELCKVVAQYGGVYSTHMRNEGDGLLESLDEALEIARLAKVSLQVSHLKAVGRPNWHKISIAMEKLEQAAQEGLDVNYDFYPYTASATGLSSQLPNWVHEGGWEKMSQRLRNPETRQKIISQVDPKIREAVGWHSILVSSVKTDDNRGCEGKNLEEIAEFRGQTPVEAMLDLLLEENGSVGMIKFSMTDEGVNQVAAGKLAMVGSDGSSVAVDGPLRKGKPHPRTFGTFPRAIRVFWREQKVVSLEEIIHKMTGMPAKKLKLLQRGFIQEGFHADLTIFDPETITDQATFTEPHQYSTGVKTVFVNGVKAYQDGEFLDPKSGVLLKPSL